MKKIKKSISTFSIQTLGCSKNVVDSEKLIGLLESNGIKYVERLKDSEAIIINTCGFIQPAKEESVNAIFQAIEYKKKYRLKKVIVMGCLSERYSEALRSQIKGVDYFFGVNSFAEIISALKPDLEHYNSGGRRILTFPHTAYLKIADGCSHNCSFCAIPLIKGKFASLPLEEITAEADSLAAGGVKELVVIAQDTTFYGVDIYKRRSLARLLESLSDIGGIEWIRLMYAYPAGFPEDVLDIIAARDNICNYIDIPLQHISDRILKSMCRNIDAAGTKEIIAKIRNKLPNAAIRSAFIVGYPGETESDFRQLYDFISEAKLDRVGVFIYSHEDATSAYSLIDDVPPELKEERRNLLMELQSGISLNNNKRFIGKKLRVLVDELDGEYFKCRSEYDAPDVDNSVMLKAKPDIEPGAFFDVSITSCTEYDLYGEGE